jgi:hypothetical protein
MNAEPMYYPNKEETEIIMLEDRRIIWTVLGIKYWEPIFKRYGKKLCDIKSFAQFEAVAGSRRQIEWDQSISKLQQEIMREPNSYETLYRQLLLAIVTGNDNERLRLELKIAVRNKLSVTK